MRIAFITYEYPPDTGKGGIGTYTVQMAALLSANGFDVQVFCGSLKAFSIVHQDAVRVWRIKCNGIEDFSSAVVDTFSTEHLRDPFDVIESPEIHANAWFIKKKFPSLPLIVRLHAPNYLVESLKQTYLPFVNKARYVAGAIRRGKIDMGYWRKYDFAADKDYQFALMAEHVVAPTVVMKQWAIDNWKLPSGNIDVIPNPLAVDKAFMQKGPVATAAVILFYGRLNVLKGMVTITRAMRSVLGQFPAWKWIVVGDDGPGPHGNDSMKEWMQQQLADVLSQVEFIDGLDYGAIPAYLHRASIVVIPSLFESFSYVCAESMVAGKAIIGSSGTGIAGLLSHRNTGLLAHPRRPGEWALRLQELINDKPLREYLGRNAIAAIEKRKEEEGSIAAGYAMMCNHVKQLV